MWSVTIKSSGNQKPLQSIQNSMAFIGTSHKKYHHVTPILIQLKWLPVYNCCMFKTATLDYKYLHTDFPRYFGPYPSCSSFSHNTKCSQSLYCEVAPFNFSHNKSSTQFYFSFAFEAPKLGNDLPDDVHGATFVFAFIGTR